MNNTQARVFMLVKPECGPYMRQIQPILRRNGLTITDVYRIEDWITVARHIYEQRIAQESRAFAAGFEGHLWLSAYLFGRVGFLLLLKSGDDDLIETAIKGNRAKAEFRASLPQTRDGRIVILANVRLIEELTNIDGAVHGELGILEPDGIFRRLETTSLGLWDYFYLKYVHVPSPSISEITYEWNCLVNQNIVTDSNHWSAEDWISATPNLCQECADPHKRST